MTRTRRFLSGVSLGLMSQALVTLVGLAFTPFLITTLGTERYGLWLVATQILAYLMLADLGIVALLPRETAYVTGRTSGDDRDAELRALVGRTLRLVLWQTALVTPAAIAVWLLLPDAWRELRQPLAFVVVAFVVMFPARVIPAVLIGLQEFAALNIVHMVTWSTGTLVTFVLLLRGAGLQAVATGWITTQLLSNLAAATLLYRRHRGTVPRSLPPLPWSEARTLLTKGGWVSMAQVSQALLAGSDILILGRVLGPAALTPYSVTGKLIAVLGQQPSIFMHSALPALAEMRAADERARLARVTTALAQAMLILTGLVACIVIAVNRGFVSWWVDPVQFGGMTLTLLLLLPLILRQWNFTLAATMLSFGHERRASLTALADGAVTVGLMLALVRGGLGVLAAPIAMSAGALLVSLPLNLSVVRRELGLTLGGMLGPAWSALWRAGLVAAAAMLFAQRWVPASFVALAATTIAVTVVYVAIMLPLVLRGPLAAYVVPRLPRARIVDRAVLWAGRPR